MTDETSDNGGDALRHILSHGFIERQVKMFCRMFRGMDPDLVQSATHKACLITSTLIQKGKRIANPEGYVFRCARREIVRLGKLERRSSNHDLSQLPAIADMVAQLEHAELMERVGMLLPKLPSSVEVIIRQHYLEGISIDMIAKTLNISRSKAFAHRSQGLGLLRNWLS